MDVLGLYREVGLKPEFVLKTAVKLIWSGVLVAYSKEKNDYEQGRGQSFYTAKREQTTMMLFRRVEMMLRAS